MKKIFKSIFRKFYRKFLRLIGLTKDKTSRNLFQLFKFAAYAALIVFLINLISLWSVSSSFGTFGDFFGGVLNPILTFLTFMGLLITIVLQQKELALTRQELHTSAQALSQQAITQEKQRFEDTFFALLGQHNMLLDKINVDNLTYSQGQPLKNDSIVKSYLETLTNSKYRDLSISKSGLISFDPILNNYFRVLYQILKFIASNCPASTVKANFSSSALNETECSQEEKLYANIVRSFISENVCILLAINCFCKDSNDHFIEYKLLVERYSAFEHMHIAGNYSNCIKDVIAHYSVSAFGKNTRVLNPRFSQ